MDPLKNLARPRDNFVTQFIGWAAYALGVASLFSSLQDSLNAIWRRVHEGWHTPRYSSLRRVVFDDRRGWIFFGNYNLEQSISLAIAVLVFALIYKILPDVTIAWRDVWPGASMPAVMFLVGEFALSHYLAVAGMASAYGAAGPLLAVLLWIYYSAIILVLGAEFTKLRAGRVVTIARSLIRQLQPQPAGIDLRQVTNS